MDLAANTLQMLQTLADALIDICRRWDANLGAGVRVQVLVD